MEFLVGKVGLQVILACHPQCGYVSGLYKLLLRRGNGNIKVIWFTYNQNPYSGLDSSVKGPRLEEVTGVR